MARVGIVFTQRLFWRNWSDTGILESLAAEHDMSLFTTSSIIQDQVTNVTTHHHPNLSSLNIGFTHVDRIILALERRLSLEGLATLRFKFRRHYFGDLLIRRSALFSLSNLILFTQKFKSFLAALRKSKFGVIALLIPKSLAAAIHKRFLKLEANDPKWNEVARNLLHFDFVLIPTASQEPELFPLIRALQRAGANSGPRVVAVMENWDNLTSKITFPATPDFVTLMGESQISQARELHGFQEVQCILAGLPKFQGFKVLGSAVHRHGVSTYRKRDSLRVLYLGFSMPCREHEIANLLMSNAFELGISEVHYRPHPARQHMPISEPKLDARVIQVAFDSSSVEAGGGLPPLDKSYYDEFTKYDLVVTPPTTLAIEYVIAGAPVILDFRKDEILRTAPGNLLGVYPHISELFDLSVGLRFSEADELLTLVEQFKSGVLPTLPTKKLLTTLDFALSISTFMKQI